MKYHEDFEKNIKGSKIQVADDPETKRNQMLTKVVSQVEYKGHREDGDHHSYQPPQQAPQQPLRTYPVSQTPQTIHCIGRLPYLFLSGALSVMLTVQP